MLPVKPTPSPEWLHPAATPGGWHPEFRLSRILDNSLYYPSSAFDGDPVKHLAGRVHSFVYVDQSHSRAELLQDIRSNGFTGYQLLHRREISESELVPNGWTASPPAMGDGDPERFRDSIRDPFCEWFVFGKLRTFGMYCFSLLYLCADGVATYQALYVSNLCAPLVLAVLQPGHAFGDNWTDYANPDLILHRSVLGNPVGSPRYLLYGGYSEAAHYSTSCWPEYDQLLGTEPKAPFGHMSLFAMTNREELACSRP